jgi:hypothetical protein
MPVCCSRAEPRASTRRVLAWAAALAVGACAEGQEPSRDAGDVDAGEDAAVTDAGPDDASLGPRALVHSALWRPVPWGEDPFDPSGGAEPPLPCEAETFGEENLGGELVFYVRTERCASLTVRQASRAELRAGETVEIRVYHFPLTAPVDASAQLTLQIGETRIWERELPIPSPAAEIVEQWEADQDYAAGTPLLFHVNNHGNNEYTLIGVDVL